MACNDGQRLTVFGLSFRRHDNRKMHRILDHYERLPTNANDRAALYANLAILARDLPEAETASIKTWLANDDEFPFARPIRPPQAAPQSGEHDPPPGYGRHDPAQRRLAAAEAWDGDGDEDDSDMDEFHDIPHPPHLVVPPARRAQRRGPMNRHNHRGGQGHFQGNDEFGRGQLFGNHGEDDDIPAVPQQAPRNPPRPRHGGFGQGRNGALALDPYMGHGPLPPPLPMPQMQRMPLPGFDPRQVLHNALQPPHPQGPGFDQGAPPPHRRVIPPPVQIPAVQRQFPAGAFPLQVPAGRRRGGFGQALPGALDPFMGHGPPMGFPHQHAQQQSAFDITGPGRRLGEEGEETPPEPRLPSTEKVEPYEQTINQEQEHLEEEDEDMNEDMDDIYVEPPRGPQFPAGHRSGYPPVGQQSTSSPPAHPAPEKTVECEVCYEDLLISEFPPNKITAVCQHEAKVCYGCLEQDIAVQIGEGVLGQLKCPSCPEKLSYEDIQAYASPDVFRRYKYLLSRADKNMFMCLAPNCGGGQIHDGGKENPLMICRSCDFKICTYHGRPWHEGQTCVDFDCDPSQIERLEEEEATAKLLAVDSRICHNCGQGVTKQIGCDHMLCRCGKAWCFVCEADWENILRLGGPAHARHCTYHPDSVRKGADQLNAERDRALHAVHGGEVSEELRVAREKHQEIRKKQIRENALKAVEVRLKAGPATKEPKNESKPALPKKRLANLKPAWEEGGHTKKPFGG